MNTYIAYLVAVLSLIFSTFSFANRLIPNESLFTVSKEIRAGNCQEKCTVGDYEVSLIPFGHLQGLSLTSRAFYRYYIVLASGNACGTEGCAGMLLAYGPEDARVVAEELQLAVSSLSLNSNIRSYPEIPELRRDWFRRVAPGATQIEKNQGHGDYPSSYVSGKTHVGVDLNGFDTSEIYTYNPPDKTSPLCGTPVRAWARGKIVDMIKEEGDPNYNSLGYMVLIEHNDLKLPDGRSTFTIYLHLVEPPALAISDEIEAEAEIGKIGQTGASTGCHLHFEVRHFAGRFNLTDNFRSIYGNGDVRNDPNFLKDWTNPGNAVDLFFLADTEQDAETLFDWAENEFPKLFPDRQNTQSFSPWLFRYYPSTNTYAGVNTAENNVYVLGGPWDSIIPTLVGSLTDFSRRISELINLPPRPSVLPPNGLNGLKVSVQKSVYTPQESIIVQFSDLPGNQHDWITIVPASASPNFYQQWFYTDGLKAGEISFGGLVPGDYEVRLYYDWPNGGYIVQEKQGFQVKSLISGSSNMAVSAHKSEYAPQEQIIVHFSGLPGNQQDWITIVPASASPNSYQQWFYTNGVNTGEMNFSGLAPGEYEVRVYYDWPNGGYIVQGKYSFRVRTID